MSHLQVCVGPFFWVPKVRRLVSKDSRHCANVVTCKKPASSAAEKFCSSCGSPIVTTRSEVEQETYPQCHHLGDEWVDEMSAAETESGQHVWMANHYGFDLKISDYADNTEVEEITPEGIAEAVQRFTTRYKGIAEAFKAKFGVELKVSYGAVPFYR